MVREDRMDDADGGRAEDEKENRRRMRH
jgi:hypothetical protein